MDNQEGKKGIIEEAKEAVKKLQEEVRIRREVRLALGLLDQKEYQRLPPRDKRAYRIRHGAPKNEQQIAAQKKAVRKRQQKNRMAKKSRKVNYQMAKAGH